jgi:hypothetical protein
MVTSEIRAEIERWTKALSAKDPKEVWSHSRRNCWCSARTPTRARDDGPRTCTSGST